MIRYARKKDREALLDVCLTSMAMKEKTYLEYYFHHVFQDGSALISELDNKLISQIHMHTHVLKLKEKRLEVSYLSGIATHYDYRKRGIMRDLMEIILEDCSNNHLLTFMEASNPRLFERYGFEVLNERKRYTIYAKEMLKYSNRGVSEEVLPEELVQVYRRFAKRFDCYYDRDENYYTHLLAYTKYSGMRLCVYRDEMDTIKGYALYMELDDGVEVKEIIYEDTKSLCRMLRYAIGYNPFIAVEVSSAERLEKVFKLSIPRSHNAVMVRMNNLKLFNKLYNSNIKNVKDLKEWLDKPILIHEKC